MGDGALKKAGIIVGFTIIVLAIGIWCFANSIMNSKENPKKNKVETNQTNIIKDTNKDKIDKENVVVQEQNNNSPVIQEQNTNIEESVQQSIEEPVVVVETPNNTVNQGVGGMMPSTENSGTFTVIDSNTLGEATIKEELMLVANKRLIALDSNQGGVGSVQLQYVVDLVTTDNNKISIYVNGGAYDVITVGGKLIVTYKVYKNDSGIEFPLVMDAKTLE